jgi:acyl carrier protein
VWVATIAPFYPDDNPLARQRSCTLRDVSKVDKSWSAPLDPSRPPPYTNRVAVVSFAQQRLWFLDQLVSRPGVYNVPAAFDISGYVDVKRFRTCLYELVTRHTMLRTGFEAVGGQPIAVTFTPSKPALPLQFRDLSALSAPERAASLDELTAGSVRAPFHLPSPPLWRALLAKLSEDRHRFVWTFHHAVADGWSISILIRELVHLLAMPALDPAGNDSGEWLAEPSGEYAEFAEQQRRQLAGPTLAGKLSFWRDRLAGAPELLELPADRPRPPAASYAGDAVEFTLPRQLRAGVTELARRLRTTPFVVLLVAFKLLLFRYTGQPDLVVGVPVAARTRPDLESVVGTFTNLLPVRTTLTGEQSGVGLVRQVRTNVLEALEQQDLPFDKLVEELQPARTLSHHPVFQVVSGLTTLADPPAVPGLQVTALPVLRTGTAKYDLALLWYDRPPDLLGAVEYATDLFDRATIEQFVDQLVALTAALLNDPDQPVSVAGPQCRAAASPSPAGATVAGSLPPTRPAGPRTATEMLIARVWQQVLELDQVGLHDSFFDLGGHSLLAIRMLNEIRAELEVALPVTELFTAPTVAGLAAAIERRQSAVRRAPTGEDNVRG